MKLNRVHHIAIIAADYEASKHFCCDVLGCELLTEVYRADRDSWMGDLALNGEHLIEPFSFPGSPRRPGYPEAIGLRHLAFEVNAIDLLRVELIAKGVECEPIQSDPHTGRAMMFFFDPDGLPLELYER